MDQLLLELFYFRDEGLLLFVLERERFVLVGGFGGEGAGVGDVLVGELSRGWHFGFHFVVVLEEKSELFDLVLVLSK